MCPGFGSIHFYRGLAEELSNAECKTTNQTIHFDQNLSKVGRSRGQMHDFENTRGVAIAAVC
jgi:hypothetical protein